MSRRSRKTKRANRKAKRAQRKRKRAANAASNGNTDRADRLNAAADRLDEDAGTVSSTVSSSTDWGLNAPSPVKTTKHMIELDVSWVYPPGHLATSYEELELHWTPTSILRDRNGLKGSIEVDTATSSVTVGPMKNVKYRFTLYGRPLAGGSLRSIDSATALRSL